MLWFLGASLALGWFLVWVLRLELTLLVVAGALAVALVGFLVAALGFVGDRAVRPSRPRAAWPRDLARSAKVPGMWALRRLELLLTPKGTRR